MAESDAGCHAEHDGAEITDRQGVQGRQSEPGNTGNELTGALDHIQQRRDPQPEESEMQHRLPVHALFSASLACKSA